MLREGSRSGSLLSVCDSRHAADRTGWLVVGDCRPERDGGLDAPAAPCCAPAAAAARAARRRSRAVWFGAVRCCARPCGRGLVPSRHRRRRGDRCGRRRPEPRRSVAGSGVDFVATLRTSSSDSSPSVRVTRSALTSATFMPLIVSPARTRRALFPAISRRNAVFLPSTSSVPVRANWPRFIRAAAAFLRHRRRGAARRIEERAGDGLAFARRRRRRSRIRAAARPSTGLGSTASAGGATASRWRAPIRSRADTVAANAASGSSHQRAALQGRRKFVHRRVLPMAPWRSLPRGLGKRVAPDVELHVDLRLLAGRRA